jgi:SAM-dependent methyltransferase
MRLIAGCGPKPILEGWVGLDLNPEYARRARQESPGAPVLVGDILALPFPDDSVDEILCWEVFEHIEQQDAVIDEFHRVCRPGGKLMLSTPMRHIERFLSCVSRNYRESVLETQHQNCLSPRETLRKVRRRFEIERVWYDPIAFAYCLAAARHLDRMGVRFNDAGELVGEKAEQIHHLATQAAQRTRGLWTAVNSMLPYWGTKSICLTASCRKQPI